MAANEDELVLREALVNVTAEATHILDSNPGNVDEDVMHFNNDRFFHLVDELNQVNATRSTRFHQRIIDFVGFIYRGPTNRFHFREIQNNSQRFIDDIRL